MQSNRRMLVSVVGPTAVGKTAFAINLAMHFDTEIISADSRQFYREMEVGTAKPDAKELAMVRHHFINSHSVGEYYNVGQFEQQALALLQRLYLEKHVAVAVGGSGLYFKALWEGLDDMPEVDLELRHSLNQEWREHGLETLLEELARKDPVYYDQVDRNNHQRVIRALEVIRSTGEPFSSFRKGIKVADRPFTIIKIGLEMDRETLYERINTRMDVMIQNGLFGEAGRLIAYREHNALQTVGYAEIFDYLDGKYDYEEAVRLLKRNSRRYAKRQMTWFKKDPEIIWMHPDETDRAIGLIADYLQ